MSKSVKLKRNAESNVPQASNMSYGEIAIGYKKGSEKLFIKNTNNEIVAFELNTPTTTTQPQTYTLPVATHENLGGVKVKEHGDKTKEHYDSQIDMEFIVSSDYPKAHKLPIFLDDNNQLYTYFPRTLLSTHTLITEENDKLKDLVINSKLNRLGVVIENATSTTDGLMSKEMYNSITSNKPTVVTLTNTEYEQKKNDLESGVLYVVPNLNN